MPARPRRGFTLIELLVVIAIIAVLIGLLLPAVQRVREAANRAKCLGHMKQLAVALHNYHDHHGRFPPSTVFQGSKPAHLWATHLLPFVEQQNVHALYRWDVPWDDPANQPVVRADVPVYVCPSAPGGRVNAAGGQTYGPCDYSPIDDIDQALVATGLLAPWAGNVDGPMCLRNPAAIPDVTDGTSNTLLLTEVAGRPELWVNGRRAGATDVAGWATANGITPINLDGWQPDGSGPWGPCGIGCTNVHEVYGFHPGGVTAAMADGSVRFLRANTPITVLAALVTKAGGEVLPADGF